MRGLLCSLWLSWVSPDANHLFKPFCLLVCLLSVNVSLMKESSMYLFPFPEPSGIPSVFCVFSPLQADAVCDWIREMFQLSPNEIQSLGHSEVHRMNAVSWIKVPGLHMRHQSAKSHSSPSPCRRRQTRTFCSGFCNSREGFPGSCRMNTAAHSSSSTGAGKARFQRWGPLLLKLQATGPQVSHNCLKSPLFLALPRHHPEASHSCPVFLSSANCDSGHGTGLPACIPQSRSCFLLY